MVLLILLGLTSCKKAEPVMISGEVASAAEVGTYFLIDMENGRYTGIVITNKTEIDYGEYSVIDDGYLVDVVCTEEIEGGLSGNIAYSDLTDKWYRADKITVTGICTPEVDTSTTGFAKPVIYLYSEEETDVTVTLDYNGELTCTYPESNGTWSVTAQPDGTLVDENGQEYNYLYWEGKSDAEFDFSKGFCVKGEDTAEFLETALANLGLTRREANEFIVYWLPLMEVNEYNVISFQGSNYEEHAKLTAEPIPDTVIRVFMAWYGTDEKIEIEPQKLTSPEREGFILVEWGGSEIK